VFLAALHHRHVPIGLNRITLNFGGMKNVMPLKTNPSHRAWVATGKPHDGAIAICHAKLYAYKHALKRRPKMCQEHNSFTNELHEGLFEKDPSSFYKTWNAKFGSRLRSQVV